MQQKWARSMYSPTFPCWDSHALGQKGVGAVGIPCWTLLCLGCFLDTHHQLQKRALSAAALKHTTCATLVTKLIKYNHAIKKVIKNWMTRKYQFFFLLKQICQNAFIKKKPKTNPHNIMKTEGIYFLSSFPPLCFSFNFCTCFYLELHPVQIQKGYYFLF